jgi:hypothetical protein
MPVTIGTTFWRCPVCKEEAAFDGDELATVGTPYCGQCEGEEQEMEPLDDPIPTVLYLDDGENETYIGVALRPRRMSVRRFKTKIAKLWQKFLATSQPPTLPPFNEWLEEEHGILFLKSDFLVVEVNDTD